MLKLAFLTLKTKLLQILLFLCSATSFAQIRVQYLDNPPAIDGNADDWESTKRYTYQAKKHVVLSRNQNQYAFGYDEVNLYAIFEIRDKHLVDLALDKSGSPRLTFNDAIEFYIDSKGDSHSKMDADDYQVIVDLNGNLTVFRGGDKFLMQVVESQVPKDTITDNFVMDVRTNYNGTISKNQDTDLGYVIEFQIPWASLGTHVHEGSQLKIDVGFNDADEFLDIRPLTEEDSIPNYSFESIGGQTNLGFPEYWQKAILVGKASFWKKINQDYGKYWWILGLVILIFFMPSMFILIRQNYKLRQIRPKDDSSEQKFNAIFNEIKIVNSEEETFIKKAKTFILQNLDQNTTPAELADELSVSLRQLQRIFKDKLDTTPTNFITSIKMEEAAVLLRQTDKTISEVAYSVGFSDPAYFTRTFKKYFAKSPSEFTKNNQ